MNLRERSVFLAKQLKRNDGELTAVLIAMKRERLFAQLGFTGVFTYCQQELGLSEAQCHYFQKVVDAAVKLPTFEKAVTSGEISLSQARRIVPVVVGSKFITRFPWRRAGSRA